MKGVRDVYAKVFCDLLDNMTIDDNTEITVNGQNVMNLCVTHDVNDYLVPAIVIDLRTEGVEK